MPEQRPSVTVSIINYRTPELTLASVASVLDEAEISVADLRIAIVDNASNDGSVDAILNWIEARKSDTQIDLICSQTNSGFSGGHNHAIAAHKSDFFLLLNSDATLGSGSIDALLEGMRESPDVGLVGPRIVDEDGASQNGGFRFASPTSELVRGASTGPVTRLLSKSVVALGPEPDPYEIDWISFACVLIRDEMIKRIGPMDEGYFLYFEDAEYCLRAGRAGWKLRFQPVAEVCHLQGASGSAMALSKARRRMPAYFYASRTRFLFQKHGHFGLLLANICWHLGRLLAHLRILVGKPVPAAHRSEALDIWTNFLTPLGSRHAPNEGNEG
ncbi:MAG: glycosyltransferase family 2 protein [Pseudomonadota bacterium]